jgi:hypothetical protein
MSQQNTLEEKVTEATIASFNSDTIISFQSYKGLIDVLLEFMKMHYQNKALATGKCKKVTVSMETYTKFDIEFLKITMFIVVSFEGSPYTPFKSSLEKMDWNKNIFIRHEE